MNQAQVLFRLWDKKDFQQVSKILQKSWYKAYLSFIPKEDLDFYLNQTYNVNKLKELFNDKNTICYVAEVSNETVGWLKLLINKEENRFYISSIYVLPEFQKLKTGRRFMDIALAAAKKKGFSEIWIGVMENNTAALKWYKNIGFQFTKSFPFTMGNTTVNHLIGVKKI